MPQEHAVIVSFKYESADLEQLFAIEEQLIDAITTAAVGEYDGNDMAADGSNGTLYMYGPDADKLFAAVSHILGSTPFMRGATVKKRYGGPEGNSKEVEVRI